MTQSGVMLGTRPPSMGTNMFFIGDKIVHIWAYIGFFTENGNTCTKLMKVHHLTDWGTISFELQDPCIALTQVLSKNLVMHTLT